MESLNNKQLQQAGDEQPQDAGGGRALRVAVVGSIAFDIAVQLDGFPRAHETVLARSASTSAGGKGLCQAVAAARYGAQVEAIGLVGDDMFGDFLLAAMLQEGLGATHVGRNAAGTQLAVPMIAADGNNRIISAPRAGGEVHAAYIQTAARTLASADLLLLQGEVPLDACVAAIELASDATVVWNPAPASFTLEQMLAGNHGAQVSWITPNEIEAEALSGIVVTDAASAIKAAEHIRSRFPGTGVVVTLGAQGSVAVWEENVLAAPAFTVDAVDPTAAGDAFTAVFAVNIARQASVADALLAANAAGALAATKRGAVTSIPDYRSIEKFIIEQKAGR